MASRTRILLNELHDEQARGGYLSERGLKQMSKRTGVPISRLYAVATFYLMFHTRPQGRHVIELCGSPSCVLNDGTRLQDALESQLKVKAGETTADGSCSLYKTSCIGCCDEAPALLLDGLPQTNLTAQRVKELVDGLRG